MVYATTTPSFANGPDWLQLCLPMIFRGQLISRYKYQISLSRLKNREYYYHNSCFLTCTKESNFVILFLLKKKRKKNIHPLVTLLRKKKTSAHSCAKTSCRENLFHEGHFSRTCVCVCRARRVDSVVGFGESLTVADLRGDLYVDMCASLGYSKITLNPDCIGCIPVLLRGK